MHTCEWLITYSYNSELGHTEMSAVCDADPFDCEEMLGYDEIHKLLNSHADLLEALEDIRDLARTGTAPMAFNMTPRDWDKHKLNKVAGEAHQAIEKARC